MLAAHYQGVSKTDVPCAGCGSTESLPACRGDRYGMGIRTVVCACCGLIFTSPRPAAEWFSDFYRNHYRQFYKKVSRPDEAWVERPWIEGRHRRNVEFLAPYLAESGMALDAGCSEGTFLAFLQEQCPGWTVHGVETNAEFAEFARSYYGLQNITIGEIEELVERSPEQFDFVAANHVLEHLLDPALFLGTVRGLLKPGGLLFLDVPDAEGEKPGVWNLHVAHVYHFSAATLGNLLRRHGFEIVTWKKGEETPHPWTLRVLARQGEAGAELPRDGEAQPVDAEAIARAFAARSLAGATGPNVPAPHVPGSPGPVRRALRRLMGREP